MVEFLKIRLKPFGGKAFRAFFFAQCLSLVGSWSHELARSWLVLDLAGTTTALGTLLLCMALPGILLTLHGGALADRLDARKILLLTKSILTFSAFLLFFYTRFFDVKLGVLYAFALVEGIVNSYDGPAFTAVFARTLPKDDFRQGLALQSMSFHLSRMVGPAIAGVIMAFTHSAAAVFLFDAATYLLVIYIIWRVPLREKAGAVQTMMGRGVRATIKSLKFFFDNPSKRYKQFQLYLGIALSVPMLTMVFRSFLKQKFTLDAEQFGYLFSFPAVGSMIGAFYLTFSARKKPMDNLYFSVPLTVISLLVLEHASTPLSAAILLGVTGFAAYLNMASITQTIQIETPDHYRGRLGALITLGFGSLGPLLSFPIGIYADFTGFEAAIRHITLLFAAGSLGLFYLNLRRHRRVPAEK